MSPRKICAAFGCEQVAIAGKARCEVHQQEADEKRAAQRADAKASAVAQAGSRFYRSQRWRIAARRYLQRHPLCVDCLDLGAAVAAQEVDHIKPHRGDAAIFWDRSNWQALCKSCHSRKTAREVLVSRKEGPGVG